MSLGQTGGSQLAPHRVLRLAQLEPESNERGWRRPGQTVRCSAVYAVPTCTALLDFGTLRNPVAERKTSAVAADMPEDMSAVEDVFAAGSADEHAPATHDKCHLVGSRLLDTRERYVQRNESETGVVGVAA